MRRLFIFCSVICLFVTVAAPAEAGGRKARINDFGTFQSGLLAAAGRDTITKPAVGSKEDKLHRAAFHVHHGRKLHPFTEITQVNTLTGFSTSAPIIIPFVGR